MRNSYRQISKLINDQTDILARNALDRQYNLQAEDWKPYGQSGYQMGLRDMGHNFSYLAEAVAANDPSLFLDYTGWAKSLFAGLKLPPQTLTVSLECMSQALQEVLPPKLSGLPRSYIDAALLHLPHLPEISQSFLLPEAPLHELAVKYLETLLRGDRQTASRLILDAVEQGASVKDIYLHVFQLCQREVGRLWQMNRVSVAQEHFCTAATQVIMSQLYPYIFATEKKAGRRLVATTVGGEFHEIGVHMVTDFLEMEGWDTYYLGANTPDESILRALEERQAGILAISATITFHVSKVRELIDRLRSALSFPIKIMTGGYPFNIARDLWKEVGADAYARDAHEAVSVAERLVQETR